MAKKTSSKKKTVEPSLDPILPLPAGTGMLPLKQGDGRDILESTQIMMVELPYRAFFNLWEHAERRAAETYPRYVGGPLDRAAQASLEAVVAFRSANRGVLLEPISEAKAQKIRAAEIKQAKKLRHASDKPTKCPHCSSTTLKNVKRDGKKLVKCLDCKKRWPRSVSTGPSKPSGRPSKALEPASAGKATSKSATKREKPAKKATKKRQKSR